MNGISARAARFGTWRPERQRAAALALAISILTGMLCIRLGEIAWYPYGGAVYVILTGVALVFPAAIAAQVIGGQVLVASLLLGPVRLPLTISALVLAVVILTAELLATVARMDTPLPWAGRKTPLRTVGASLLGGVVFVGVMLVGSLPGPTGISAVMISSAACGALAVLLAWKAR